MNTRHSSVAMLLALVLAASPAWAAKLLVLQSNTATLFHKSQMLDGRQKISLPDGAVIVLMDETGRTVTIKGPYTGAPGGADRENGPTFLQRLSAMIQSPEGSAEHPVLGATRAFETLPAPPDLWAIDVTNGGSMCTRAPSRLSTGGMALWRPAPRPAAMLTITGPDGASAQVAWAAGEAMVSWPPSIRTADSGAYKAQLDPGPAPQSFVLHVAPGPFSGETALLEWLSSSNCVAQARAMLVDMAGRRVVEGPQAAGKDVFE
jgi:hypothetical protein